MSQTTPNPKHRWWNLEPRYIIEYRFLKVNEDGYVYMEELENNICV
jgi:hypothetical protein